MSIQVTLTLPDNLYESARRWAAITRRDLSETLTDALTMMLPPVSPAPSLKQPVDVLSDEDVLAQVGSGKGTT
jgi:hypothetical protein